MVAENSHADFDPVSYERRILLCLTGMSPQIVTETIYALSVLRSSPWIPTEVHLITTSEGARLALDTLFDRKTGQICRLFRDYGIPEIALRSDFIYTLRDHQGQLLSDIRSDKDNEAAADFIEDVVRTLTMDPDSALHLSLAGGRKTMGLYAGYTLSLFGRQQDRLSHVLVSHPFESISEFFYPPPQPVLLKSRFETDPVSTQDAQITLASIPFVLLRHILPDPYLATRKSFHETIAAAQHALPPHQLHIDLENRSIRAGKVLIHLSPSELAFLSWFARRKKGGMERLSCPRDGLPRMDYARDYLTELKLIRGEMGDIERSERALRKGMDQDFFEQKRSRLNHQLQRLLKHHALPYQISGKGTRGKTYEIGVRGESITFSSHESKSGLLTARSQDRAPVKKYGDR